MALSQFKSNEEYLENSKKGSDDIATIADYKQISMEGQKAIKTINPGICKPIGNPNCQYWQTSFVEILLIKNGQGYKISYGAKDLTGLNKLDQFPLLKPDILSTFKFTQ